MSSGFMCVGHISSLKLDMSLSSQSSNLVWMSAFDGPASVVNTKVGAVIWVLFVPVMWSIISSFLLHANSQMFIKVGSSRELFPTMFTGPFNRRFFFWLFYSRTHKDGGKLY